MLWNRGEIGRRWHTIPLKCMFIKMYFYLVTFFTLVLYLVQVIYNDFTFRCFVERVNLTMVFKEVENHISVRHIAQREFTHRLRS